MNEKFENCDLSGAAFHNVNLARAEFEDVSLTEARIHNANLSNLTIEDAFIKGFTVMGFRIDQLIGAELDRRDPERVRLRMEDCFDPECVRAVLQHLGEVRAEFVQYLRAIPPDQLAVRPAPDQWSAVENLRHLIFAEDLYLNRWLLQNDEPWCEHGLLPDFLAGNPRYTGVGSQPCEDIEELLASWDAIHTRMMAYVARVTQDDLRKDTSSIDFGQGVAGKVLQTLAQHDLEHIRQIEAAVNAISTN